MGKLIKTLLGVLLFLYSTTGLARHIFLNGVDIGNLRNETLKNVTVKIAPNGDIFIVADQYQAIEDNQYVPVNNSIPMNKSVIITKGMEKACPQL